MIKTILIVLVAVVVLIVIIAVLALRFLRADDSDVFDEIPEEPRRASKPAPETGPEPARERPWAPGRGAQPEDDRGKPGYRERTSQPRLASQERARVQNGGQRPLAASARSAKPARQADQDAEAASWESLSDVDYWAELAADKPLTTTGDAGAGASAGTRAADQKTDPRQQAAGRQSGRSEAGLLPVRQPQPRGATAAASRRPASVGQPPPANGRGQQAPGRYVGEPATESISALARLGSQGPAPAQRPRSGPQRPGSGGQRHAPGHRPAQLPQAAATAGSGPSQNSRANQSSRPNHAPHSNGPGRQRPLDDDPLTSPSFPAINASDSRSYRTPRPGNTQPQPPSQPGNGRGMGGFTEPARSPSRYPTGPDRAVSTPDGYPVQPVAARVAPVQGQPSVPMANPYGSYVSAPQPASQEPARHAAASYVGYTTGPQASVELSRYRELPATGQDVGGHAAGGTGYGSARTSYGSAGNGYPTSDNGNGYGPGGNGYGTDPGYRTGSNGYGTDPGYRTGSDSYGTDPGYGTASNGYGRGRHGLGDNATAAGYSGISYQDAYPQAGQAVPAGYPPQEQATRQYDQRGYGTPELAYGPDAYPGYPGYGGSGR